MMVQNPNRLLRPNFLCAAEQSTGCLLLCFFLAITASCQSAKTGKQRQDSVSVAEESPKPSQSSQASTSPNAAVSPKASPSPTPSVADLSYTDACPSSYDTANSGSYKISVFDEFSSPKGPLALKAKIEKRLLAGINPNVKNTTVDWRSTQLGGYSVKTDDEGQATWDFSKTKLTASNKPYCVKLVIGSSEDNGRIFMASPTDPIIVTDIDEVLSDLPEVQVPFKSNANTKATEGSIEALKSLAPKARIIYLTARDNSLFSKTRAWLRLNGFPSGPVFVWNWNLKNYLGLSREEQRAYKAKFLEDLKKRFPHIVAAIGNRSHDAQAFIDAGVPAYILTKDSAAFSAPVVTAPDWQDLSTKINAKLPLQN